jgi:oligoribonuclease NrnB/cAMP/cGMP phosphodiesterase (DHH superfamily)
MSMPIAIQLLGRYDVYDTHCNYYSWENLILPFQYGMKARIPDLSDIITKNEMMDKLIKPKDYTDVESDENKLIREISKEGEKILSYVKDRNSKLLKQCGHKSKVKFHLNQNEYGVFIEKEAYWVTDYLNNSMVFGKEYSDDKTVYIIIKPDILKGGYELTLYSTDDSEIDVSAIAREMGGGGHKHAAGFYVDKIEFHSNNNVLSIYRNTKEN